MDRNQIYQFGPFSLDAAERVLVRDGRVVPLAPKAVSTLLVLVRNQGHVVEKDALMTEVWPDEIVEEANLAQHVFMLRRVLGDNPRYIETIPRRGYRFLDAVAALKSPSRLDTKNTEAYRSYLAGHQCWSKHTRESLNQAIRHFQRTIDLDSHFALAYAGIVDSYLRLATNYLPPAETSANAASPGTAVQLGETAEPQAANIIGCELPKKIAEREYKHALELKFEYPTVHQWYAACIFSQGLYNNFTRSNPGLDSTTNETGSQVADPKPEILYARPTLAEEVQIFCTIARTQIDAGNYDAACAVLDRWWTMGEWPKLDGLNSRSSADLLLTVGTLAGFVAGTKQVPKGQKHAEALLNGAIAFFEQLGSRVLSAGGRIELALCYQREGMFDLARATFQAALEVLLKSDGEIRRFALIGLAIVEWQAGHLQDSAKRLNEAEEMGEVATPTTDVRYHMILAATLHKLAAAETGGEYFPRAREHYLKAIDYCEAVGNHRYGAIGEANYGYLLGKLGNLDEAETHLFRARKVFEAFDDERRCAQVDDSFAHVHLAAGRLETAELTIRKAVESLENGGMEAYLVEALTTQGLVLCKLERHREAKRILERAYSVAERCGDRAGAAGALLTEVEQMCDLLEDDERLELESRLNQLLADSQQTSTLARLRKYQEIRAGACGFKKRRVTTAGVSRQSQ